MLNNQVNKIMEEPRERGRGEGEKREIKRRRGKERRRIAPIVPSDTRPHSSNSYLQRPVTMWVRNMSLQASRLYLNINIHINTHTHTHSHTHQ